jgi:hypothetical protein
MNDSLFVRRREGLCDLAAQIQKLRQLERSGALFEPRPQRLALQKLHHDVGGLVRKLPEVRDLHQPRMIDAIHGARFAEEAVDELGALRVFGMQHLDGHVPLDGLVNALEDLAHPTFAKLAKDAIDSNRLTWLYHRGADTLLNVPSSVGRTEQSIRPAAPPRRSSAATTK